LPFLPSARRRLPPPVLDVLLHHVKKGLQLLRCLSAFGAPSHLAITTRRSSKRFCLNDGISRKIETLDLEILVIWPSATRMIPDANDNQRTLWCHLPDIRYLSREGIDSENVDVLPVGLK
jgi:hypothetical protein